MAKRYEADEVKRSVPVRQYLKDQGVKVRGNRCVASWRGGTGLSCAIYEAGGENRVYDNKENRRLSVIDLCMELEGCSFKVALATLGDRYGVPATDGTRRPPKKPKPEAVPNWVRISWLIIHADDAALIAEALHTLPDIDRKWARRVAGLLADVPHEASLDEVIKIAIDVYHATAKGVR